VNILEHFIACIKDCFPKKEERKIIQSIVRNSEVEDLTKVMLIYVGCGGSGGNVASSGIGSSGPR